MKSIDLIRKADRVNNKNSKKVSVKQYKNIVKNIKRVASKGGYRLEFTINIWDSLGWESLVAVRFFKFRHRDFKVVVTPIRHEESDRFFDCDRVRIAINFK